MTRLETQTLVLCPTRELADQVTEEIRRLAKRIANVRVLALCDAQPAPGEVLRARRAYRCGTPGRVLKHLLSGTDLRALEMVLDEADGMLDMGFSDEIDAILDHLPQQRRPCCSRRPIHRARSVSKSKTLFILTSPRKTPPRNEEHWSSVYHDERLDACGCLKTAPVPEPVFCNTKSDVKQVTKFLQDENIAALSMHGDLEQFERTEDWSGLPIKVRPSW